jgi:fatty-acyl-CoA synthase
MTGPLADNFASHFEHIADLAPDRLAVASGCRELSWAAFDELADRLAGYLFEQGLRPSERVGLNARNSPEYLIALHALFKLGATPVNVNYRYRAAEVHHVLASARARAVIADADVVEVVREATAALPGCELIVPIAPAGQRGADRPDQPRFGPEITSAVRQPRRPRGNAEWLLFTGGTTGTPKAVTGSHTERLRAVRAGGFATLGLDPADGLAALHAALDINPHGVDGMVTLTAPPLMHGTGLYSALGALAVGAPVVVLPTARTTGSELIESISRHRVTDLIIVGDAFALRLLDALDEAAASSRPLGIDSLRRIRSVGAVWSAQVKRRLLAHAELTLLDTVAASEGGVYAVSQVTRATPAEEWDTFRLAPGARLLDEQGTDVVPGTGQVGMLAAPVVSGAGYEHDPAKTAVAFRDLDGVRYSIPGDCALMAPDGRLRLLGRGSSVINTGGEKVFPDEIESVLRGHPSVRDATVLGVPDDRWGEVIAAVVSLRRARAATPDELCAFVRDRLAGYKKPRRMVLVPEVRRLATGKPDLRWAARLFADEPPQTSVRCERR